jgi:hypothetical protein
VKQAPEVEWANTIRDAFRTLLEDSTTRNASITALEKVTARQTDRDLVRRAIFAWINQDAIRKAMARIEEGGGFEFGQLKNDSAKAHRKAAAIQDVLQLLGYHLGPAGSRNRGYYGGPPGNPRVTSLEESLRLVAKRPSDQKLLAGERGHESWTRDGARRLQAFLGWFLGENLAITPQNCLSRPDGLFGRNTLEALGRFMEWVISASGLEANS